MIRPHLVFLRVTFSFCPSSACDILLSSSLAFILALLAPPLISSCPVSSLAVIRRRNLSGIFLRTGTRHWWGGFSSFSLFLSFHTLAPFFLPSPLATLFCSHFGYTPRTRFLFIFSSCRVPLRWMLSILTSGCVHLVITAGFVADRHYTTIGQSTNQSTFGSPCRARCSTRPIYPSM